MKQYTILLLLALIGTSTNAQVAVKTDAEKPKIYNPKANAEEEIHNAVVKAAKENKHVLLQVGGNWCVWCVRFNSLVTQDVDLKKLLDDNYEIVHVNYSPENTNEKVLMNLGYPQRFGFPVFVVLNGKGERLHTQNSGYLEDGQGHSKKKVAEFLNHWSPKALDPKNYIKEK
ncbi:MAG: thioredoxin family protein [Bacteroidota bacterium]